MVLSLTNLRIHLSGSKNMQITPPPPPPRRRDLMRGRLLILPTLIGAITTVGFFAVNSHALRGDNDRGTIGPDVVAWAIGGQNGEDIDYAGFIRWLLVDIPWQQFHVTGAMRLLIGTEEQITLQ